MKPHLNFSSALPLFSYSAHTLSIFVSETLTFPMVARLFQSHTALPARFASQVGCPLSPLPNRPYLHTRYRSSTCCTVQPITPRVSRRVKKCRWRIGTAGQGARMWRGRLGGFGSLGRSPRGTRVDYVFCVLCYRRKDRKDGYNAV